MDQPPQDDQVSSSGASASYLLEILQKSSAFLSKKGVPEARLQAEHLLAHVLQIPRLELYLQFERQLQESELTPLRHLLRARAERTPLQHLLGTSSFYGRDFLCDARALIPRPETEQLIELALTFLRQRLQQSASSSETSPPPLSILDIGTGSGIIPITLACELPNSSLRAIDLSAEALSLAQENAQRHQVEQIEWLQGDLLAPLTSAMSSLTTSAKEKSLTAHYDLITANLPYIPSGEMTSLQPEVRHDPHLALDGGSTGTELIERLIATAPTLLHPQGGLLLEIGIGQEEILRHYLELHHYQEIISINDYQGIPRFLQAQYN